MINRYVVDRLTPKFLRDFFDGADRESLVIVPLQQAADCFLAPAALVSAPTRLVVFGNVIFAAHSPAESTKRLEHQILKLNGFSKPYCQIKWIFPSIRAPIK